MNVEVDDETATNAPFGAGAIERDDEAVEGAKPFAVIGVGVVKSARERRGNAVFSGRRQR